MFRKYKNQASFLIFFGALLLPLLCGRFVPTTVKAFLYAVSLCIKEGLVFCLPFVIFSLLFSSISRLGNRAFRVVLTIFPLICCSNFLNTMLSYGVSKILSGQGDRYSEVLSGSTAVLDASFHCSLTPLFSNDAALVCGLILGLLLRPVSKTAAMTCECAASVVTNVFFKILLPLMPLFIVGMMFKMQHDGILSSVCGSYLPVLLAFVLSACSWILLQYILFAKGSVSKASVYVRNVFPAVATAFGSASSAAAMPLSLKAAEKNCSNAANADIIVPSTVNVHLVGDCFFIPMFALSVLQSFGLPFPSFGVYLLFAFHFVLAKFAVAAVPGGGVLVMLPILQNYLGLTPDMLALVTAIYILFDPIITACNVAGNGAFAIFFDRIGRRLQYRCDK